MFLLVSVRHVGAHPDELQPGVSIQSSINLCKTFPRISRIRITPSTQILARVFVYLPPFISQILDFICWMVLIFILIYFEWRDTENQQYTTKAEEGLPTSDFQLPTSNFQLPTSHWEVMAHISIYCGFCFWSAGFPLWCKSMLFKAFY